MFPSDANVVALDTADAGLNLNDKVQGFCFAYVPLYSQNIVCCSVNRFLFHLLLISYCKAISE
jgi:hypothetical protein